MQQEQYFKAVKASERPKESGWIIAITKEGKPALYMFTGSDTSFITLREQYTHYLEPIQLPDAQILRGALEKILAIKNENIGTYLQKLIEIETIAREALSAGDGWVRCGDKKPCEADGQILATNGNGFYEIIWYSEEEEEYRKPFPFDKYDYPSFKDGDFTHWRPLPSPPIK